MANKKVECLECEGCGLDPNGVEFIDNIKSYQDCPTCGGEGEVYEVSL